MEPGKVIEELDQILENIENSGADPEEFDELMDRMKETEEYNYEEAVHLVNKIKIALMSGMDGQALAITADLIDELSSM